MSMWNEEMMPSCHITTLLLLVFSNQYISAAITPHTARVTQQCLHKNCPQMIQKKQWPSDSPNVTSLQITCLGSDAQSFFWNPHLKPNTVSELKITLVTSSPSVYWKRPPGRPWMTWMKTVQNDLDSHGLSWTDAIDLAQNRPLWRLLATSGATHS